MSGTGLSSDGAQGSQRYREDMIATSRLQALLGAALLGACATPAPRMEDAVALDFLTSPVRETVHRDGDDLLTAGLGLAGLRGAPVPFADPAAPTAAELRRRAIQSNWQGIADLGPLGGYGEVYGNTDAVPGREYQAFAKLPEARSPHRVLAQVPDDFDLSSRCLLVSASSGSRGIYGAIALAGAWGLRHRCAVVYTDKGAGTGYFDPEDGTGVALDGTRARAGEARLEFVPEGGTIQRDSGIAVKHAHSRDNPEADWGRHVLQAARFGLAMLERAFPQHAPFTPANTRIFAVGLSNGGGAVLQAAGLDREGLLAGVVALAPNIFVAGMPGARPLYDYATEAALLLPCALTDARFAAVPLARGRDGNLPLPWTARCRALHERGMLAAADAPRQAAEARERLSASGWTDAALVTAASTTAFDLWRAVGATYASAYTRSALGSMPCGYRFVARDANGKPRPATPAERASWWADASGIPPGAGVFLDEATDTASPDPTLAGLVCLRALWTDGGAQGVALRAAIAATHPQLPRKGLPIVVIHGQEDGLLPSAFTSEPYVAWLRAAGREPLYWPIAHAQHFDAFLALPAFGDRYVPLLPYGYAALDRLFAHVLRGAELPTEPPRSTPRGASPLTARQLGLALP
jgi:hydroxybutyrate-dimer hydrolase